MENGLRLRLSGRVDEENNNRNEMRNGPSAKVDVGLQESVKAQVSKKRDLGFDLNYVIGQKKQGCGIT